MSRPAKFRFKSFLHLVRVLFPKWSFFAQIGAHFEVAVRASSASPWEILPLAPAAPSPSNGWSSLFFNPHHNLILAHQNLIEHFVTELQDLTQLQERPSVEEIETLTTFPMLVSWIQWRLQDSENPPPTLQFKIVAVTTQKSQDLFVSHWLPWSLS
jgi:hypothetical protein